MEKRKELRIKICALFQSRLCPLHEQAKDIERQQKIMTHLTATVFKVHLAGILQCAGPTQLRHGHASAVPRAVVGTGHWKIKKYIT